MKFVGFVFLSFLCACQTAKKATPVRNYIQDGSSWNKEVLVSGKTAYVGLDVQPKDSAVVERLTSYKTLIEEKFRSLGFKIVDSRVDAHVWIELIYSVSDFQKAFPGHFILKDAEQNTSEGQTITEVVMLGNQQITSRVSAESGGQIGSYYFLVYGLSYGERPKYLFWQRLRGPQGSPEYSQVLDSSTRDWVSQLSVVNLLVKEQNQKGQPGCMPRFGFEVERMSNADGNAVISDLGPKNSPARKAGLKVGDVLVAVDSYPYDQFSYDPTINEKIYKERIEIPIKFLRGKKEMRSKIKAEILCF